MTVASILRGNWCLSLLSLSVVHWSAKMVTVLPPVSVRRVFPQMWKLSTLFVVRVVVQSIVQRASCFLRRVTASSLLLAALCVRRNCDGAATGVSEGSISANVEAVDAVCGARSCKKHGTKYVVISRRVTASPLLLAALCVRRNCDGAATGVSEASISANVEAVDAVCGTGSCTKHRTTYAVVSRCATASLLLLLALCVSEVSISANVEAVDAVCGVRSSKKHRTK